MRLAINRPDVTDEDRLALATPVMTAALQLAEFGPPEPVEINLCDLVSDSDAEALLAPHREGRAGAQDPLLALNNSGLVDLTQPGESECSKLIFTEIYVKAATTAETDFDSGADIAGVAGVPVDGLGDAAVWFAAVPHSTPFSAPHEIGVMAVRWGRVSFRIVLALPGLNADETFAAARRLSRKALGSLPDGPGEVIVVDRVIPDLSNAGFVDNLLTREADEEWTYEEGLIGTLKFLVGEANAGAVLRHSELLDNSGTGIIALAQEYLESASGGPSRREVRRLVDLLLPPVERGEAPDLAGDLTDAFETSSIARQGEEEPPPDDEEPTGYAPPPPEDGPFEYAAGPPLVPGECANFEPTLPGWKASGFEMIDYGPWTAAVLFPEEGLELGWNRETHLARALQALADSMDKYGAPPVCIQMLFSHHGGSYTFVEQRLNPEVCAIFINRPSQNRNQDHFKQQLAADIAHCYIPFIFPNQFDATYLTRRWWNHAVAEYLSNVVYTDVNLEWRLAPAMQAQETSVPLVERKADNWMFFQQVANDIGDEGVAAIINALPGGNDAFLDELALADLAGMQEFFHRFSELMSDAAVEDTSGLVIPYTPPKITKQISGKGTHEDELGAFQATRWDVSVPPGCTRASRGRRPRTQR